MKKPVHYDCGSPACDDVDDDLELLSVTADRTETLRMEVATREIAEITCEKCLAKVAEWASEDSVRRMRRIGTLRMEVAEAEAEVADLKRRMAYVSSRLLRDLRKASDAAKARKKIEGGAP